MNSNTLTFAGAADDMETGDSASSSGHNNEGKRKHDEAVDDDDDDDEIDGDGVEDRGDVK